MKLDGPIGPTVLDSNPGLVGAALDRVDGRLKVTGAARYAVEVPTDSPLNAFIVQSTVASGRITGMDTEAAKRAPGVRLVLTEKDTPLQGGGHHRQAAPQMTDTAIYNWGQPIALVVADTFEQARDAAHLVRTTYAPSPVQADLHAAAAIAKTPESSNEQKTDSLLGSFDAAYAEAPVKLDVTYTTPVQSHAAMEPHGTVAHWEGDTLVLQNANQMVSQSQAVVAHTLQIPKENVRLISKYVGGGFGAKLWVGSDAILAAIAAKKTGRPVKLAMSRQQVFHVTTHRSDTVQRIRLAADRDGRLLAIGHDTLSGNRTGEPGYEGASLQTRTLYAAPNRQTRHRLAPLTRPVASSMRAPGEAVGMLALESAMDELAVQLDIDPIELRRRNEPAEDPEKKVPFSSRHLLPCLEEGARRFGWDKRGKPGETRDGRFLVGMGVASAIRNNPLKDSKARIRLDPDGVATVQMSMTDIGTGTYTILNQVAASMLGLAPNQVRVELGDSRLPMSSGSGGSFGAASSGSALYDACLKLRTALAGRAGLDPDACRFAEGRITAGDQVREIRDLVPGGGLVADGDIDPGENNKKFSQQSYGAHFAEVGVDRDTGEIRLRRMLGVFTAGRILNEKTARSQAIGGMIFGVGAALHEDLVTDTRFGLFVNHDLAEYHVPVNADIVQLDAMFLLELDPASNPLRSKGIGELGICGAGAAIANAVFNATGIRIRDYPLTLDKVLAGMERRA